MNIEQAISTHLRAQPGITALVGHRVYPLVMPDDCELPAITYSKISRVTDRRLGTGDVTIIRSRIQVSCWATSYSSAKAMAEQIHCALQSYRGVLGGADGVEVLDATVTGETDLYEQSIGVYHIPVDVLILHR